MPLSFTFGLSTPSLSKQPKLGPKRQGTHEKPGQTLELSAAICCSTSLVVEQQAEVGAHGSDTCASGSAGVTNMLAGWNPDVFLGGFCA